jgi:RNase P subunit RPR2
MVIELDEFCPIAEKSLGNFLEQNICSSCYEKFADESEVVWRYKRENSTKLSVQINCELCGHIDKKVLAI